LRRHGAIGDDSRVDVDLDSAAFPDDAARLRALLVERDAVIAERDAALAERDAALLNARFEIEKLKVRLAALRRERYGKSSERLAAEIGQLEMLIGDLEEDGAEREAAAAAAEKARRTRGKSDKPRQPALRRPLPEHLPRETVLHEPLLACRCGCTDPARLTRLGEAVTEVLEKTPARLKVIRHVRPRYACRACEAVIQAPAPVLSELAPTGLFWTPESRWYAPGPTGAEFWMDCVCCGSAAVAERPERTARATAGSAAGTAAGSSTSAAPAC
jgi:hypothetical protein